MRILTSSYDTSADDIITRLGWDNPQTANSYDAGFSNWNESNRRKFLSRLLEMSTSFCTGKQGAPPENFEYQGALILLKTIVHFLSRCNSLLVQQMVKDWTTDRITQIFVLLICSLLFNTLHSPYYHMVFQILKVPYMAMSCITQQHYTAVPDNGKFQTITGNLTLKSTTFINSNQQWFQ